MPACGSGTKDIDQRSDISWPTLRRWFVGFPWRGEAAIGIVEWCAASHAFFLDPYTAEPAGACLGIDQGRHSGSPGCRGR